MSPVANGSSATPPRSPASSARRIRAEIGITASAGVSINKLVSKVASDAGKPDGLVVGPGWRGSGLLRAAPRPRPADGRAVRPQKSSRASVSAQSATSRCVPVSALVARFGNHGAELHARALGIYNAPVVRGRGEPKSISREMTFNDDEPSHDRLRAVLRGQAERVAADLARQGKSAATVTLKLRFPPFETLTRSATAAPAIELADDLFRVATGLFTRAWEENGRRPVRLIGCGVTNLHPRARQLRLGETLESDRLQETITGLRDRFGDAAVRRGAELSG